MEEALDLSFDRLRMMMVMISEDRSAFFWDVMLYRQVNTDVSEDSSASSDMLHGVDKHLPTFPTLAVPSSPGTNSPSKSNPRCFQLSEAICQSIRRNIAEDLHLQNTKSRTALAFRRLKRAEADSAITQHTRNYVS